MYEALVHGVKGKASPLHRAVVPLAAARRKCWYFFLRGETSARVHRLFSLPPAGSALASSPHQTGSADPTVAHYFGLHVRRSQAFPALERSFHCSGKKAAYADRTQIAAAVCAARCAAWVSVLCDRSKGVNELTWREAMRRGDDELRLRNGVWCVKRRKRMPAGTCDEHRGQCERPPALKKWMH
jgi:hypothetical protein